MIRVAPQNISCMTRINYEMHFSWQAQYSMIWTDSRNAKCCNFQYKMHVVGVKSNLGCEAGCGVTVLWSDPARIILGSAPVFVSSTTVVAKQKEGGFYFGV